MLCRCNRVAVLSLTENDIGRNKVLRLTFPAYDLGLRHFGMDAEIQRPRMANCGIQSHVRFTKSQFHFFLLTVLLPFSANAENNFQINVYLDKTSSGWATKHFDYALVAEKETCRIQWNAVEDNNGDRFLSVRKKCQLGFPMQQPLHSAILKEIDQRWGLKSFKSIDWGSLCDKPDWSWCEPIARASLQSKDFIDYYQHYPRSKLKELNGLFVELANQTNSYVAFTELFKPFGVSLKLTAVEKVFTARASDSYFPEELSGVFKGQNVKARVMYNAGMAYFSIVK